MLSSLKSSSCPVNGTYDARSGVHCTQSDRGIEAGRSPTLVSVVTSANNAAPAIASTNAARPRGRTRTAPRSAASTPMRPPNEFASRSLSEESRPVTIRNCIDSTNTVTATQARTLHHRRPLASANASPSGTNITMLLRTSSPPISPHARHQKSGVGVDAGAGVSVATKTTVSISAESTMPNRLNRARLFT